MGWSHKSVGVGIATLAYWATGNSGRRRTRSFVRISFHCFMFIKSTCDSSIIVHPGCRENDKTPTLPSFLSAFLFFFLFLRGFFSVFFALFACVLAAQACLALSSRYRWCMTGTPMVNKPEDIGALFSFLRLTPASNPRVFTQVGPCLCFFHVFAVSWVRGA